MSALPVRQIALQALTVEAFAPFGQVTHLLSGERRNRIAGAYDRAAEANEPRLWIATVNQAVELPFTVRSLERHPYSAQSFMPIGGDDYLVVVCHAATDGRPDLSTLQAFKATSGQGVTYARNVWHHGLSVLTAPARFVVCMSFTEAGGDDVFVPVQVPVQLVADEGALHG
jgi:ureidoglycolate lyase